MTLFLTEKCNMRCTYCYLKNKTDDIMSWEIANKAVNLLIQDDREKSLSFFGGEPLLQSDLLLDIASYVRERYGQRISLSVTTNGILLTPSIMEKLNQYNIFVVLSLDGYGEEANKYRKLCKGQNPWPTLENNLNQIAIKDIGAVRMTIVPDSVSMLYDNFSCLLSLGFKYINFAIDYTSVWTEEDLNSYKEQFIKILQLYYCQIIQGKRIHIDIVDHIAYSAIGKWKIGCHYGCGSFAVSAKGYVFPCHREVLENTFDEGILLDDFIAKKKWQDYIFLENNDRICKECDLYNRCAICMVNIKKMGGSLDCIPDLLCSVNKIHIMETDKMLKKMYSDNREYFAKKYL